MIDCWILSFLRNMSTYYRSLTSLSFIPMRVRWLLLWRCVRTNVELQLVRVWDWETVENSCSSWCSRAGDSIGLIITEQHWTLCNQSINKWSCHGGIRLHGGRRYVIWTATEHRAMHAVLHTDTVTVSQTEAILLAPVTSSIADWFSKTSFIDRFTSKFAF